MSNKDESAFYLPAMYDMYFKVTRPEEKGLTKREYAAIQIMAGLAANGNTKEDLLYAPMAVRMADNLFTELEKEPT